MHTETLIIGAGPAGLAMAGALRKIGKPFLILEKTDSLTPAWRNHYDRLHLHTVKDFSNLPHKPFPQDWPQYIPKNDLVAYYEDYARENEIAPVFGEEVARIEKEANGWVVLTQKGSRYEADRVVVATGFNCIPNVPRWPGQADFEGDVYHSKFYKNGKAYAGKRVLVVGMGNSGAEIALDLFEHGAQSFLSVRNAVNIVRRDVFGRPTQLTAMMLRKLPTPLGDFLSKHLGRLTVGDMRPYGLQRPSVSPLRQMREFAKTTVIDVGTIDKIKAGDIRVFPGIDQFTQHGVVFTDGREAAFDAVVLATGYESGLSQMLADSRGVFDAHGIPKGLSVPEQPGLFFLGFDAYATGLLMAGRDGALEIAGQLNA